MRRLNMDSLPSHPLPPGYSLELYRDDTSDKQTWAEIAMAAGEFKSVQEGLDMFDKFYGENKSEKPLSERIYFLINADGKYIGTASAGTYEIDGEEYGTLEWVSIIPEYQGRKLAKPMVSAVLHKIAEYSNKCYLGSQTTSWRALNMYADFGFKPFIKMESCRCAWELLSQLCKRKFIEETE